MSSGAPRPGLAGSRSIWNQVYILVLREHLLGILTYVGSVPERQGNALLGLTLLACAVLWSSCDGVLARVSSHGRAIWLVEGVLLYVGAIAAANLFRFAFGQASVGW